jgi:MFS family permease
MPSSLFHDKKYRILWVSRTLSMFGAQISLLALPLIAVTTLHAGPTGMSLLRAAELLPYLIFSLIAGAVSDRLENDRVVVLTDFCRTALLLAIPACAWLGALNIWSVAVIAFGLATLSVFSEIAIPGLITHVVDKPRLLEANSKLASSASVAEAAGPAIGGFLISTLTGAFALIPCAIAFLLSALSLKRLATHEEAQPKAVHDAGEILDGIFEGMKAVRGNPVLMSLALRLTVWNFSIATVEMIFLMYASRTLNFSPLAIGILFSAMGGGIILGSMLVVRLTRTLGTGRTIGATMFLGALTGLTICALPATTPGLLYVMCFLFFAAGFAYILYQVNHVSMIQETAPDALLGRVSAAIKCCAMTMAMIGVLMGGWIAERVGLRESLIGFSAFALGCAVLGLIDSPLTAAAPKMGQGKGNAIEEGMVDHGTD